MRGKDIVDEEQFVDALLFEQAVKAALKITLVDYENLFIVVDKPGNKGIAE